MSKQPLKYLKNEVIEDLTTRRIREYEAKVWTSPSIRSDFRSRAHSEG